MTVKTNGRSDSVFTANQDKDGKPLDFYSQWTLYYIASCITRVKNASLNRSYVKSRTHAKASLINNFLQEISQQLMLERRAKKKNMNSYNKMADAENKKGVLS